MRTCTRVMLPKSSGERFKLSTAQRNQRHTLRGTAGSAAAGSSASHAQQRNQAACEQRRKASAALSSAAAAHEHVPRRRARSTHTFRRREPAWNKPEGTTACLRRPQAAGRPHARRKGAATRGHGRTDAPGDAARCADVGGRCDSVAGSPAGSLMPILAGGPQVRGANLRLLNRSQVGSQVGRDFQRVRSPVEPSQTWHKACST